MNYRRPSDIRSSYETDSHFNSVFDRGPIFDRPDDRRRSIFGSGYFDCFNNISRASSTESLLDDLSVRATTLFHSLDPLQRGYINMEDLFTLNCDLNEEDLLYVFRELDQDKDGCINVDDFKAGLKLINKQFYKKNIEKRSRVNSLSGWSPPQELEKIPNLSNIKSKSSINIRSSEEGKSMFSCEEKICDYYETVNALNPDLADQFNSIIQIILNDLKDLSKEKQGLIAKFHREKLMYENSLRHLEEEYESQIELICKKETRSEAEKIEKDYQSLLMKKQEELTQFKERLHEAEESYRKISTVAENIQTQSDKNDEINHLKRENNNYQVQLVAWQTENTMIRSEFVTMKQQYNDKISRLQQEINNLRTYEKDWEDSTKQLQMLREINRQLQDTNDSLRSVIETSPSASEIIRRISSISPPVMTNLDIKLLQCDPGYNKLPFIQIGKEKINNFRHNSLPDEHGDSGLSTLRDVTELESEVEPMNFFTEMQMEQRRSHMNQNASGKIDDHINDCQTQSLERTMVSRPNSLPMEHSSRSHLSNQEFLKSQHIDLMDGLKYSGIRSNNEQYDYPDYKAQNANVNNNIAQNYSKSIPYTVERMYKIIFVGDASVGKSTFIMRLCTNSFIPDCVATIGMDFRNKPIEVDGKYIVLQLWDTAGQERFRSMTANYFRKADGVLLLYDCSYVESFINVRSWVETIRSAADEEIPIVLVANKCDLRDRYIEEGRKTISKEIGCNFAKDYNMMFMETSAKSGENILKTMEQLARVLTENEDMQAHKATVNLTKERKPASATFSSCCK